MATAFGAVCVEENLLSAVGTAFCDRSCALWAWRVQSHTSHTSMSGCNYERLQLGRSRPSLWHDHARLVAGTQPIGNPWGICKPPM